MKKSNQVDYKLFFSVIALIVFWMIMISSVSVYSSFRVTNLQASKGLINEAYNYFYVLRNMWHVFISMLVLFVTVKINYKFFERYAKHFFWFSVILLFVVLFIWMNFKWARWWINIPWIPFTIQPTEFLKLSLVLLLASLFKQNKKYLQNFKKGFLPFLWIMWWLILLIWLQPDFWTIMVIVPISIIMYFYSWINIKHLLVSIVLGFVLIFSIYSIWTYDKTSIATIKETKNKFSYISDRIDNFLDDNKEAIKNKTINYQTEQALIAIGSWWFTWLWFWNSIQKFGYLPEVQWDFIFSVIIEELWFLWWLTLLLLYLYIWYRWLQIARWIKDPFAKYVAIWISTRILMQAFINIWVNLNIVPLTWITLPFISYWWSSLLSLSIALWILLNISRGSEKKSIYKRVGNKKIMF